MVVQRMQLHDSDSRFYSILKAGVSTTTRSGREGEEILVILSNFGVN